jgi:adenine deaminase
VGSAVNVCVVGLSRAGMVHAVNFQHNVPGAGLVAVGDGGYWRVPPLEVQWVSHRGRGGTR